MSLTLPSPILPFLARFPKLLQANRNYSLKTITKGTSSKSHDGIHLKILPTLLEVFLRRFSYCCRKAFNDPYDKINEFSNFKYNLVSQFNKLQDTATKLGSKSTFLRACNSLLKCDESVNIQFN